MQLPLLPIRESLVRFDLALDRLALGVDCLLDADACLEKPPVAEQLLADGLVVPHELCGVRAGQILGVLRPSVLVDSHLDEKVVPGRQTRVRVLEPPRAYDL